LSIIEKKGKRGVIKMKKAFILVLLLVSICLMHTRALAEQSGYPNESILLTASSLEKLLNDEKVYILDVRNEGNDSESIPGAIPFNMNLIIDEDHPIKGHLVRKEKFEKVLRDHGIKNDQTIVIYDKGRDTAATRLFYALEYYGHGDVKVLNGGFAAWEAEGKKTTTQKAMVSPGDFKANEKSELMTTKEEVLEFIGKDQVVLLDVRSPEEYKGEDVRAKRGGHIPSAVNIEWKSVLRVKGVPQFKSAEEIAVLLESGGVTKDKKVVVYCQKANRASHMYFTLRLMGYNDLTVYEGSWEEWGNDPTTPIVNPRLIDRELRSL
jgi:thiosulfate/3-mercaptopyruvate sulfurtransferase